MLMSTHALTNHDFRVFSDPHQDFGVPQHRPRLFIVGIRRSRNCGFKWPRPTTGTVRTSLDTFLDKRRAHAGSLPTTAHARQSVLDAVAALEARGHDPRRTLFVINAHASTGRVHVMQDRTPCITFDRGGRGGHSASQPARRKEASTCLFNLARAKPRVAVSILRPASLDRTDPFVWLRPASC